MNPARKRLGKEREYTRVASNDSKHNPNVGDPELYTSAVSLLRIQKSFREMVRRTIAYDSKDCFKAQQFSNDERKAIITKKKGSLHH